MTILSHIENETKTSGELKTSNISIERVLHVFGRCLQFPMSFFIWETKQANMKQCMEMNERFGWNQQTEREKTEAKVNVISWKHFNQNNMNSIPKELATHSMYHHIAK